MKMGPDRIVLLIAAVLILLMLAFPPFVLHGKHGMTANAGYSFILSPSRGAAIIKYIGVDGAMLNCGTGRVCGVYRIKKIGFRRKVT